MPTYRLLLEYDGAAYHGWQTQSQVATVQGALDRALTLLLREEVRSVGAGRTDRGVHARGQVASFRSSSGIRPERAIAGITGICGASLRARRFEEAPPAFHARHSAIWREYSYRILLEPSSYHRDRAWWAPSLPGLGRLRACAAAILGTHDFSAFANQSPDPVDPVCNVLRADWGVWEGGLLFTIRADHFLYKMVRTTVGTMVREARPDGEGAQGMQRVLATRNRALAAPPSPAHGLCLEGVGYDPPWPTAR